MNLPITIDELQAEIGRLHVQVMAYEKERVRLEARILELTPQPAKTELLPPVQVDPKTGARIL